MPRTSEAGRGAPPPRPLRSQLLPWSPNWRFSESGDGQNETRAGSLSCVPPESLDAEPNAFCFAFSPSLALDRPRGAWGGSAEIVPSCREEQEGDDQSLSDPRRPVRERWVLRCSGLHPGSEKASVSLCPCALQTWVLGGTKGRDFPGPALENLLTGGRVEGEETNRQAYHRP